MTDNEIRNRAKKGDPSILSDPGVSKLKDFNGDTPLHWLAYGGVKEVLKHPDVSKVKNKYGETPLHELANRGVKEVWSHPDFDKVKDNYGETPKDWWLLSEHKPVTCMDFIE